ncbi:MAG: enoyl-CoA hydratase/isomerase family protein [Candidatus Thorarchaeota archaeon]|nr:MAG: enoyl-CoA hydratase/isomerase family protein [Candidatus Thorarchaeota archaeon]
MNGEIIVTIEDSYAIVKISRPEKLNAVTKDMLESFSQKVSTILNNPKIRAIIITGEGEKSFTAGFDLDTVTKLEGQEAKDFFKLLERTMRTIRQNRSCVTVAAVNGYAIGFGAMISIACDFRIISEKAIFRLLEIDLSIFPGAGAASNLYHLVGPSRTKDILMTGRKISAEEAMRIGLADRMVKQEEIMKTAIEFVKELLTKDPKILIRTKTLIDAMTGKDLEDADELETAYLDEWLREG